MRFLSLYDLEKEAFVRLHSVSNKKVVLNLHTARELNTDNMKLILQGEKMQKKKYGLTPVENQSPSGVGVTSDLMPSTIDTAVDAAEDRPHFLIRTPPLYKSVLLSLVNNTK